MHCIILIADPDQSRLEGLSDFFESHGFRCITARTGSEALETATNYLPHVVVLNEDLPEIQGTDVCLRIKHEATTSHAWIIVMGPDAAHEEKFVSNEVGADRYLTLDTKNEVLLDAVHTLLRTPLSDA